jgi:hypothetical protein
VASDRGRPIRSMTLAEREVSPAVTRACRGNCPFRAIPLLCAADFILTPLQAKDQLGGALHCGNTIQYATAQATPHRRALWM